VLSQMARVGVVLGFRGLESGLAKASDSVWEESLHGWCQSCK